MKRWVSTLLTVLALALGAGVGTAAAGDDPLQANLSSPTSATDEQAIEQGQVNASDQEQIQFVPIAPQANVQNANVATFGEVEQGNANNANTGQAAQQENNQVAAQSSSGGNNSARPTCDCGPVREHSDSGDQSTSQRQGNASEQEQIQFVPIAPQANVQNVNVLTFDDVEQGNANNANTGQATQQENNQVAVQDRSWEGCKCSQLRAHNGSESRNLGPAENRGQPRTTDQTTSQSQGNWSEQEQIQFVPIAPQLNVQNVNALTFDDVEQGNANNANTGQATQQENNQVAVQRGSGNTSGGQSQTIRQGQGNASDQDQIQFIPIAPQANVQNVNVLTFDDVEQGNANNANTGQATQQENNQVAVQSSRGGHGGNRDNCGCSNRNSNRGHGSGGGDDQSIRQGQGNWSEQEQIQFIPIAPQLNVQNVNVLTFDDVEQGNANNANTGQATQQENNQVAVQSSRGGHGGNRDNCGCSNRGHGSRGGGDQSIRQGQANWSEQEQIQFIPIAPQANVQNVNVLTFDDVEQGNANNANTGQATQQENNQVAVQSSRGGHGGNRDNCGCSNRNSNRGHGSGGGDDQSIRQGQGNWSEQEQIQFIPIAPQLNVQNVNVLTFDDVEQGNANNANTGQATQQENNQVAVQSSRGGHGGNSSACRCSSSSRTTSWNEGGRGDHCRCSRPSGGDGWRGRGGGDQSIRQGQANWSEQEQIQFIPIAPQANVQNVNVLTFDDVEQGNANNANTGQATQQENNQVAVQSSRGGHGGNRDNCGCSNRNSNRGHGSGGGDDQSIRQGQGNWSEQEQIQFIPIAPQLNVQNVNVLTFDDVEQGNANNANTGQATQQENNQVAVQTVDGALL